MLLLLRALATVAFAISVSACATSSDTAPGAPASQSLSRQRAQHIHGRLTQRLHAPPPGCTLISSVNPNTIFVGWTAASFAPGDNVTIDGTGCDVALYVGPGAKGAHLDHASFPGTPCDYMILVENTTFSMDHTTIAPPGLGCFGNGYGIPTGIGYANSNVTQDHTTISNVSGQAILVAGGSVSIDHTTVDNSQSTGGGDGCDCWDTTSLSVQHMAVTGAGYYYSTGLYFANAGKVSLGGDAATNWQWGFWSDCTASIPNTNFFNGQSVSNNVVNFTVDNSSGTCQNVKSYTIPEIMGV
jgi:hypothetical protein